MLIGVPKEIKPEVDVRGTAPGMLATQ